jgi:general secretion pathway protein J
LIEILVAMLIMGVLFAIGYGTINQALRNRETVQLRQARLVALQRTMRTFVQDFAQAAPRPIRDSLGSNVEPAMKSGTAATALVTLTRGGWSNPAGLQRATLQRVRYVLRDGRVRREAFPVLDAANDVQPRGRDLIDNVKSLSFRFMDEGKNWREAWPPPVINAVPGAVDPGLRWRPIAVEITLELNDWGRIQRIIEVTQ